MILVPSLETATRDALRDMAAATGQVFDVMTGARRHGERMHAEHKRRLDQAWHKARAIGETFAGLGLRHELAHHASAYALDAGQRAILTLDTLRERGNNDALHKALGSPPVLAYEYDLIIDGADLPRPVNYMLMRIRAPEGCTTQDAKRPFMIIDPRAGHGAGIGGFKSDSEVGVALKAGNPVYFVTFRPEPEPGQTIGDVTEAEAAFVAEILRRHPESPKPVIVGNCQGGWASLLLAATNPDLVGPLVMNGAPVAAWSGHIGNSTMRYNGGFVGGALPALMLSDLGGGKFDGAHLVLNFEMLNPGRNYFAKYADLYANVDESHGEFLKFERWWGGFHFMNENEIRWIVEQLFVGNKLARGEARLPGGRMLDIKAVTSPIVVFASWGDNITPPPQALNWITDLYADETEIRVRGQRIVYMIHEKVGHLGIFVSSSVARREHAEMASTLKTIEALAPGLYEMTITEQEGSEQEGTGENGDGPHYLVDLHERTMADLRAISEDRTHEAGFAAVSYISEQNARAYETILRPAVRAMVTPPVAERLTEAHPSRLSRKVFSDANPFMSWVGPAAVQVLQRRQRSASDNPFLALERWWAEAITQGIDAWRDWRDVVQETSFLAIWGFPLAQRLGRQMIERSAETTQGTGAGDPRDLPEVRAALRRVAQGSYADGVIRILLLLAESRGGVRQDRLARSQEVLTQREPFAALGPEQREAILRKQSLIVEFARDKAMASLPALLPERADRQKALDTALYIAGARADMAPATLACLDAIIAVLGLSTPAPAPKLRSVAR